MHRVLDALAHVGHLTSGPYEYRQVLRIRRRVFTYYSQMYGYRRLHSYIGPLAMASILRSYPRSGTETPGLSSNMSCRGKRLHWLLLVHMCNDDQFAHVVHARGWLVATGHVERGTPGRANNSVIDLVPAWPPERPGTQYILSK